METEEKGKKKEEKKREKLIPTECRGNSVTDITLDDFFSRVSITAVGNSVIPDIYKVLY